MNTIQIVGLVVASVGTFNAGFFGMLWWLQRREESRLLAIGQAQRVMCHHCELHPALPNSLWCSAICFDLEMHVVGAGQ